MQLTVLPVLILSSLIHRQVSTATPKIVIDDIDLLIQRSRGIRRREEGTE